MKKVNKNQRKVMDANEIKKLFTKLANNKQTMSDDNLFEFFMKDLKVAADDPIFGHLVTNVMNVSKIEETKYQNFEALFKTIRVSSVKQLQQVIKDGELQTELSRPDVYKSMYKKLFDLYSGKFTTLDFEVAQQLWQIYLKNKLTFYKEFLEFLEKSQKIKIHRDLWNMMYEFSADIKSINKDYKAEDGWPLFIDKFVEFLHSKGK